MKRIKQIILSFKLEAVIWTVGLLYLFFLDTHGSQHFTLCPLKNMGLDFCPGCGLGISIHYLFHLDFVSSFKAHPLGSFAVAVLLSRIIKLTYTSIKNSKIKFQTN